MSLNGLMLNISILFRGIHGMEANVAGFPRGWKDMLWDFGGDGKYLYGISTEM